MALQDQVISVPFSQGVDTKVDPKALPSGKLISLSDGSFSLGNQISKRNGYTNINSFQSLLTRSFGNQLLLGDGQSLYSYSADSATKQNVGNYTSVSVTPTNVPVSNSGAHSIRSISYQTTTTSYILTAYVAVTPSTTAEFLYINVVDATSGTVLLADTAVYGATGNVGTLFAQVFVVNGNGTPSFGILYPGVLGVLTYGTISVSSGVVSTSFGHELTNSAVTSFNALTNGTTTVYVSYTSGGTTTTSYISTLVGTTFTGTSTANTMSSGSIFTQTQSQFDNAGNVWTMTSVENTGATTATLYYFIASPSLTITLNTTTIGSYAAVDTFDPSTIGLSVQTATTMRAYYSRKTLIGTEGSADAHFYLTTYYYTITASGSPISGPVLFLQNMELQSNFVSYGGINYAVFGNVLPSLAATTGGGTISTVTTLSDQNTFFLVNETKAVAVAKCLAAEAMPVSLDQYLTYSGSSKARPNLMTLTLSGTSMYFGCGALLENNNRVLNASGNGSLIPLVQSGCKLEQFNFSDPQAYQSIIFQNTAVFNGGIVKGYDGRSFNELGFLTFPDYFRAVGSTSGGQMAAGTYGYAVTYSWTDANNQQYESFPLTSTANVASGTTGSAALEIMTLGLTEKGNYSDQPVYINIYRTDVNGSIYYFLNRIKNTTSQPYINPSYDSQLTDVYGSSLAGQPELYNTGGVLENDPPPPSMVLTVRENRLYAVDSENVNTDYWFTKTPNKGFGISFSSFLVESIDSVGGAITSQAQMDEKLVTFKETSLGYQVGDGPNDAGANSSLSAFQFVPSDTGSNNHRATIVIPNGCMFQSDKGLYLLGRGLQVTYAGSPVNSYKSEFITQATMLQAANAVRFLVSTGVTLVYNYFYDQWSTFTNHTGTSADVFQGLYTYSRYDTKVFQENATSFLDDTTSYNLNLQIAWLKLGGIQGFQRIKQMLVLGDHISPVAGHGVQIAVAYDYGTTFTTGVTYSLSSSSSSTSFQFRDFFSQQKCDALSLTVTEVTTGTSGEYLDLTDLSFLAGVKKGTNKLSAANSVG